MGRQGGQPKYIDYDTEPILGGGVGRRGGQPKYTDYVIICIRHVQGAGVGRQGGQPKYTDYHIICIRLASFSAQTAPILPPHPVYRCNGHLYILAAHPPRGVDSPCGLTGVLEAPWRPPRWSDRNPAIADTGPQVARPDHPSPAKLTPPQLSPAQPRSPDQPSQPSTAPSSPAQPVPAQRSSKLSFRCPCATSALHVRLQTHKTAETPNQVQLRGSKLDLHWLDPKSNHEFVVSVTLAMAM